MSSVPEVCYRADMQCRACSRPDRATIDEKIVSGVPYRLIAASTGLSLGALSRHRAHVKDQLAEAASHRAAERSEQATTLLDRVESAISDAQAILRDARTSKNLTAATGAVNAVTRLLELLGRVSGELQTASASGIHFSLTKVSNTVNNYGTDDSELAQLVSEATKGFDPAEITRLRLLTEGKPTA
jgi:hypothetical protein